MNQPYKTVKLRTVKLKPAQNAQQPTPNEQKNVDSEREAMASVAKPLDGKKAAKKPKRKRFPEYAKNQEAGAWNNQSEAVCAPEEAAVCMPELKPEDYTIRVTNTRCIESPESMPKCEESAAFVVQSEIQEDATGDVDTDIVDAPPSGLDDIGMDAAESDLDDMPTKKRKLRRARRRMPVWLMVAIDVVVAACVLVVFAYFHHGRPQPDATEAIVIARPTPTPAPVVSEPADIESADDADELPEEIEPTWAQKFAAHFTDTVVATDTSYSSQNVSINITQRTMGEGRGLVTYYVADIYIADIENFQTYFAKETYGTGFRQHVLDMHIASGALLAMSGDYYGNSRSNSHGVVIRNGVLYRADDTRSDVCVLYYDGTLETYQRGEFDAELATKRGAWQAWTFGPSLLDENGKAKAEFNTGPALKSKNPRGGIGYYEPGHYVFVLVDGRDNGYSTGVTMAEFALIFEELGCSVAYNLDGGASAAMSYNDQAVNRPAGGGRTISDCLIIVEVEK